MKLVTARNLTIINFIIVIYFLIIHFLYVFKVDYVIIGVLGEILTIPFLIAQLLFVVIGINYLIKQKKEVLHIISLLLLITCSIITMGSFF